MVSQSASRGKTFSASSSRNGEAPNGLAQASRDVQFKATSTNNAVDELMNKWGVELGVDKVVAAKLIQDYEKKHSITHANAEEKSYTINVPTLNYELKISSKI
jgi:hypothetical protein